MKRYTRAYRCLQIGVAINTLVFTLLALLHLYWALGGSLWSEAVLPTNTSGADRLDPGPVATSVVAFGLLVLALITIGNLGLFTSYVHGKYFRYGALAIALLFLLRAIGDFRFVGFFKTVQHTPFGINDTLYYSPLSLGIGLLSLLIYGFGKPLKKGN